MDDETRVFVRGAYQYLEKQQKILQGVEVVSFAVQKAFRELGPDAEKLYEKHYRAALASPLKTQGDLIVEEIAQLVEQLSVGESN